MRNSTNGNIYRGIATVIIMISVFSLAGCPSGVGGGSDGGDIISGGGSSGGVNTAPTANASWNQNVETGAVVYLNGTASRDPDGDVLT